MVRLARLNAPGILHHIIIRGIERRAIFMDGIDREDFLDRMARLIPDTGTACYAWVLMGNHAHFLLRSGADGIPRLMRRLLTGYAVTFNHRHGRHGQLFQNRYKSIVCQEDAYFQELVRYIHLNPLRAGDVDDLRALERYPYSGHSAIMGKRRRPWQETRYVLSTFGRSVPDGRRAYAIYIKAGAGDGRKPELTGGGLVRSMGGWEAVRRIREEGQDRLKGDERILGDSGFVQSILNEANERFERRYELRRKGYDLEAIERRVGEVLGVDREVIYAKGRSKSQVEARSLFCYWAVRELGESNTEIGRKLGVSQPAVGYAVKRGEKLASRNGFNLE